MTIARSGALVLALVAFACAPQGRDDAERVTEMEIAALMLACEAQLGEIDVDAFAGMNDARTPGYALAAAAKRYEMIVNWEWNAARGVRRALSYSPDFADCWSFDRDGHVLGRWTVEDWRLARDDAGNDEGDNDGDGEIEGYRVRWLGAGSAAAPRLTRVAEGRGDVERFDFHLSEDQRAIQISTPDDRLFELATHHHDPAEGVLSLRYEEERGWARIREVVRIADDGTLLSEDALNCPLSPDDDCANAPLLNRIAMLYDAAGNLVAQRYEDMEAPAGAGRVVGEDVIENELNARGDWIVRRIIWDDDGGEYVDTEHRRVVYWSEAE